MQTLTHTRPKSSNKGVGPDGAMGLNQVVGPDEAVDTNGPQVPRGSAATLGHAAPLDMQPHHDL